MAKSKLNPEQKTEVIELYELGITQVDIAHHFWVSPRTINRVLHEAGYINKRSNLTDDEHLALRLIDNAGVTLEQLKERLSMAPLTADNVVRVVSSLNDAELGTFLMDVTKARLNRELTEKEAQHKHNGEMQQEVLV